MKARLAVVLVLAACSPPAGRYDCVGPAPTPGHPRAAAWAAFVERERIALELPGLSLAVRDAHGRWSGSSGFVDLARHVPRRACVPQPVGSVTKLLTAVSVLEAVEAGELALDDTLGDVLPADVIRGIDHADRASLREVLGHTGGIADPLDLSSVTRSPTLARYLRRVRAARAPAAGTFAYSGAGYVLAGLAVEEVRGGWHSDAVVDGILEPLGLDATAYGRARPPDPDVLAKGYVRQGPRGAFVSFDLGAQTWEVTDFDEAAGGAVSTVDDLVTLADALLRDRVLVEDATVDEMLAFAPVSAGFAGGTVDGYGLGVLRLDADVVGWGASGTLLSYGADVYHLPALDVTYALAYNGQSADVAGLNRRLVALLAAGAAADRVPGPVSP